MKRAIFLVGFNNWGKTRTIYVLFERSRFPAGRTYVIPSVNASFTVLSASNDDFSESRFIREVNDHVDRSPESDKDFFGALCPSREPRNDSRRILQGSLFSSYEIHLILLKYKWDLHAELRTTEIENYLSASNVAFHIIDADLSATSDAARELAKAADILTVLQGIYR